MNNSIKKLKLATIISFIIFVVYTLAVKFVLVAPIGPNDTNVGLAPLNKAVDDMLGLNMTIDKFTDIFLYAAILLAFCLGLYALRQAIEGKSLMKIDKGVFWTLLFYVMVIVVYLVSTIIGGIHIGSQVERFKELWGMLSGIVYIGIIISVSLLGSKSGIKLDISSVAAIVVSTLGGMIGGMVSKRE
jgi:putative membrane protein (TIGR04086 family)